MFDFALQNNFFRIPHSAFRIPHSAFRIPHSATLPGPPLGRRETPHFLAFLRRLSNNIILTNEH